MENNKRFITDIVCDSKNKVNKLIDLINSTEDHKYRTELVFALIDNFKDDRIIPTLINLIKRESLKHYNSSIIFACNEYSPNECKDYLSLFVDIVINGDYEASMSASSLIFDFSEPYNWDEKLLDNLAEKLKGALNYENENSEFIKAVLKVIEE
jgi:hypothetical protein